MSQLVNLAKQFILDPKTAWESVKDETDTAKQHLTSYVLPLSLIPAFATFIGYGFIRNSIFGINLDFENFAFTESVFSILTTLLGVYISGIVIHKLAANYQTEIALDKAIKLVGYAYTPWLVGGIFNIFAPLTVLSSIAGLYSLYVLHLGFKPMTNVSEEKLMPYFIVSIIVIIGVYIVTGVISTALFGLVGIVSLF